MSKATRRVLGHLAAVGFQTREGGVTPFGEALPLVAGVAWDRETAQVAFLTEEVGTPDADAWRQLLFAASGLRHHFGSDEPAAFGTPLIVAIVDKEAERGLRELVEDLASHYALFSRVDLNLVRHGDLETDDALDTALAPLLPCCRRNRGETISRIVAKIAAIAGSCSTSFFCRCALSSGQLRSLRKAIPARSADHLSVRVAGAVARDLSVTRWCSVVLSRANCNGRRAVSC